MRSLSETDMPTLQHAVPVRGQADRVGVERRGDPVLAACMEAAIRASHHIHARVGWSHGPQVADPTRGAGLVWTELFEGGWVRIIVNCMAERREFLTINPEFGPPPYAPAHPPGERRGLHRRLGRVPVDDAALPRALGR
jgi:hypothetical protein